MLVHPPDGHSGWARPMQKLGARNFMSVLHMSGMAQHLVHHLLPSQLHKQGAGLEVEQPGYKLMLI